MSTRHSKGNVYWRWSSGAVFSILFAIAALLLVLEHEAHLLGMPALLLILLVELLAVGILFFRFHEDVRGD